MTEQTPTQPAWKPGDVANGYMLGQDGVWRPIPAPAPPTTSTRRQWTWILAVTGGVMAALVLGLVVVGLMVPPKSCAELNADLQGVRDHNTIRVNNPTTGGVDYVLRGTDEWSLDDRVTWRKTMGRMNDTGCNLDGSTDAF